MTAQLDQLATEVVAANLSRPEVEGIVYNLSPQQRRLFLRLVRGPADTIELRSECSLGNVSQAALDLNRKLDTANDHRRVTCTLRPHRNQYGEAGQLGEWRLVDEVQDVVRAA